MSLPFWRQPTPDAHHQPAVCCCSANAEKYDKIIKLLELIKMDTTLLKGASSTLATNFAKFTTDFDAFVAKIPQDTPEQIQDVANVTQALTAMNENVQTMDAAINPPAAPTT